MRGPCVNHQAYLGNEIQINRDLAILDLWPNLNKLAMDVLENGFTDLARQDFANDKAAVKKRGSELNGQFSK